METMIFFVPLRGNYILFSRRGERAGTCVLHALILINWYLYWWLCLDWKLWQWCSCYICWVPLLGNSIVIPMTIIFIDLIPIVTSDILYLLWLLIMMFRGISSITVPLILSRLYLLPIPVCRYLWYACDSLFTGVRYYYSVLYSWYRLWCVVMVLFLRYSSIETDCVEPCDDDTCSVPMPLTMTLWPLFLYLYWPWPC